LCPASKPELLTIEQSSGLLLLLLLPSLYLSPYQISGLPQHVYYLLLGRGVELHCALHPSEVVHGLSQRLHRILLRLLRVVAFRHQDLLSNNRLLLGAGLGNALLEHISVVVLYTR
jgi:hypothetical protein